MKKTGKMKKLCPFAKLLTIVSLVIVVSSCHPQRKQENRIIDRAYNEQIKESFDILRTFMLTSFSPGASISISYNNELIWSQGFGYASKELEVPASRETKYRIGTTSQMFTAFTLAKLQEEGKIDLNKSFYDYIPEYPKKQWDFTPFQLGINGAGFPKDNPKQLIQSHEVKTLKEYVKKYQNDSLMYMPGSYLEESNYSFALLGILAEEASSTYFQKLVQQTILDTLHLESTSIDNPYLITKNRSNYYTQDYIARLINAPHSDIRFLAPSLGFLSTADDLNKAGQVVMQPGFFSQESLDLFFTKYKLSNGYETNRGFGWWTNQDEYGRKVYFQIGAVDGGSSVLMVFPEQKLVISFCANINGESIQAPVSKVAGIFLNKIDPRQLPGDEEEPSDTTNIK